MSDGAGWQGAAGDEVRKCVNALERATRAVEQARNELRTAQGEQAVAERELDVAKRVYCAGRKDLDDRIRAPKVTEQKRQWLRALAIHDVFGAGEMQDAAASVGWEARPEALRTLASEYQKAGYFIAVAHGAKRLDRNRIEEALGGIFVKMSTADAPPPPVTNLDDHIDTDQPVQPRQSEPGDDYDEDLPF